jgi:hypothetical protein
MIKLEFELFRHTYKSLYLSKIIIRFGCRYENPEYVMLKNTVSIGLFFQPIYLTNLMDSEQ